MFDKFFIAKFNILDLLLIVIIIEACPNIQSTQYGKCNNVMANNNKNNKGYIANINVVDVVLPKRNSTLLA